ncbi:MAG TPA: hypothetical protein VIN70_01730 [Candidatus Limnocylindria bacterium]|jgi:hypothetical protein
MGLAVLAAIVILSLIAGVAVQVLGARTFRYDFLIVGATAAFAAYFASETFPGSSVFATIKEWGPSLDGFYLIPGIAFAFILATIAYVGTRDLYTTSTTTA